MKELFDYHDYKTYLLAYLAHQPGKGRGIRSKMAEELGCRVAYVSQVLNNDAHFSLEQGEALNLFLNHTVDESEFFLLLLQMSRAGSVALRKRLRQQMQRALDKRSVLKERFDIKTTVNIEDQARYYGNWYYAAIHILTTIPEFQSKQAMARELGLPEVKVAEAVDFLVSIGVVKSERGRLVPGISRLFLGNDSPFINKHHINWRLRAIDSLDRDRASDLHLSTVVSLSKHDVSVIREILIRGIEDARRVIKASPEEEMHCLSVDLFRV